MNVHPPRPFDYHLCSSLALNSIGFYQLFKLMVTPGIVVLEYLLDRKQLSARRALGLVVVCLGVVKKIRMHAAYND